MLGKRTVVLTLAVISFFCAQIAMVAAAKPLKEPDVFRAIGDGRVDDLRKLFMQSRPSAELLQSALFVAVRSNQVPALEYLIEQGALTDALKKTAAEGPLNMAACCGSQEAAEALVKHGIKPTLPAEWAALGLNAELAAYLDEHPKELEDLHSETRRHPLHAAAAHGRIETVDLLLKRGMSVNLADDRNLTPLHEAVVHRRVDLVKHLLANKADVHARTKYLFIAGLQSQRHTPLNLAIGVNDPKIAALLLEAGARLDEPDFPFAKLLSYAGVHGDRQTKEQGREMVDLLIAKTDDQQRAQLLTNAVKANDGLILEVLLKQGVDIGSALNIPPLHWAINHSQPRLALLFIEKGADIRQVHDVGTPLGRAAERGLDDVVARLLEKKADVEVGTTTGSTPLQFAALFRNVRCCELLLEAGAKPERISKEQRAAIKERSKEPEDKAIVALLKKHEGK